MAQRPTNSFKAVSFGDVHLGLPSNPAPRIIDNIRKWLHPVIKRGDIDVVFIAGDLFDRLLFLNDPYIGEIDSWLVEFITLCALTNTELICLEGTPRHDRKQSKRLEHLHSLFSDKCKFRYIQTLTIEYVESIRQYVLFVPDVIRDSAQTTINDIRVLMREMGIEKVGTAVMHGEFKYQLPIVSKHSHDESDYEAIVEHVILINHVHTFSTKGKIIAPGSFDCTAHGFKGQFGAVEVTYENGGVSYKRIINKTAMPYIKVKLLDGPENIEKAVTKAVEMAYGGIPNIKVVCPLTAENKSLYEAYRAKYSGVRWDIEAVVAHTEERKEKSVSITELRSIDYTRENIVSIVADKLGRNGVSDTNITRLSEILERYL